MTFPRVTMTEPDELMLLALFSIRRLQNRIHSILYAESNASKQPRDTSNLDIQITARIPQSISSELLRQLDSWYDSLPARIRPGLGDNIQHNDRDAWMLLRYWSTKQIIFRRDLLLVASSRDEDATRIAGYLLENSARCLDSIRHFINIAIDVLAKRDHFTWMIQQALGIPSFTSFLNQV